MELESIRSMYYNYNIILVQQDQDISIHVYSVIMGDYISYMILNVCCPVIMAINVTLNGLNFTRLWSKETLFTACPTTCVHHDPPPC
jgi:hypothetical protein